MDFYIVTSIFVILLTVIYLFIKNSHSYWKKLGVPYIEPSLIYGNFEGVGSKMHLSEFLTNIYNIYKNETPLMGIYALLSPMAIILDLDLIKNIMIKDFNYFMDRGLHVNEKDDPLSAHLVNLEGEKWKILRHKLSPTFTSGKMKLMFSIIADISERFEKKTLEVVETEVDLDIKNYVSRFSTDVIGTCAFGIECNSLNDPDAEFRNEGQKVLEHPRHGEIMRQLIQAYPKIAKAFKIKSERDDSTEFFMRIVRETIEYREKNNIQRNDFMDLLIKLKRDGTNSDLESLTINEIAAQVYVFFLGGFETSSSTVSFCLHELALNPNVQIKAREEIFSVLKNHGNKITYEAIKEMSYLQQVLNETLRMYPPVPSIMRIANKNYQIPDTKWVIEKGIRVLFPVFSIQRDATIFPNPNKFDPDRFLPEEMKNRHSCSFLPFGDGPRNCIGARFGKLQSLTALVVLLSKFEFSKCSKTEDPIHFSPTSLLLNTDAGLWMNMKRCNEV